MRILFLQNWDMGLYLFRRELIEFLLKDNDVYYCTPDGEYVDILNGMGCRFIPCEMLKLKKINLLNGYKLYRFYRELIDEIKPDAVLLFTRRPLIYGGLACRFAKAHYFPNITGYGTKYIFGTIQRLLTDSLMKQAFRNADCVFFQNSTAQKNMISHRIVRGKTRLLPGSGVNLEFFKKIDYPIREDKIRFLFVGRIRKDKGIEEFLYAIEKLHKENNKIVATIIGDIEDDSYRSSMETIQLEGAIEVHGLVKDVIPYYAEAHCVVLPSYHEGLSNALLEASSIGRPVIASDVPGCIETFDDGYSGFVCKVKDKENLYQVMKRFSELPLEKKKRMGQHARNKAENEFDRKIVVKAYSEELKPLKDCCKEKAN